MQKKLNVAIIAGGDSSEYVVSLQSAEAIAQNMDKEKYNVYKVLIKGADWELQSDVACGIPINKNNFSFSLNGQTVRFDLAFIAIHGTPGEDGKLQAYFDMLKIPYTTGDVLSSALSFSKYYCNSFLKMQGVLVADSVFIRKDEAYKIADIVKKIGLPAFVKPNNAGSSFGVSKVKVAEAMQEAIEKAFKEDDEVVIEAFIQGRELTCAVLKTRVVDFKFPICEIVSKNEFFDFDAKYTAELVDEIVPAPVPDHIAERCRHISSNVYNLLNLKGLSRVDFILKNDDLYLLEANTVPGMTNESIVPKMARAAGMTLKELYSLIIEDALDRHKS